MILTNAKGPPTSASLDGIEGVTSIKRALSRLKIRSLSCTIPPDVVYCVHDAQAPGPGRDRPAGSEGVKSKKAWCRSLQNDRDEAFLQDMDTSLAEIERTLDQMLVLAELSASELSVDRAALQKTLERFQKKIDRIADHLDTL